MNISTNEISSSQPPYMCHFPAQLTTPLLLSSPHSGRFYPRDFTELTQYDIKLLQIFEDPFVDELFSFAKTGGISLINANYARSYIDLNRAPDSFDNLLFKDYTNPSPCINTKNGYGIIPRLIAADMPLYREKIEIAEAYKRIDMVFKPYHTALSDELARIKAKFGKAILIDCHSMPQKALGKENIDIIIGDCFGSSISPTLSNALAAHFTKAGFKVRKNHIYSGGYITKNYGKPNDGVHAIQIEINRKLYFDENKHRMSNGFKKLCKRLEGTVNVFLKDINCV